MDDYILTNTSTDSCLRSLLHTSHTKCITYGSEFGLLVKQSDYKGGARSPTARFLDPSAAHVLDQIFLCCTGRPHAPQGIPQHTRTSRCQQHTPSHDDQKRLQTLSNVPLEGKIAPVENHWPRGPVTFSQEGSLDLGAGPGEATADTSIRTAAAPQTHCSCSKRLFSLLPTPGAS